MIGTNSRLASWSEGVCLILLLVAFITIQILIGGTRMVYCLPSFAIVGVCGVLGLLSFRKAKPAPGQVCLVSSVIFLGYILVRALLSPLLFITRSDVYSVLAGLVVYFLVACVLTKASQRIAFLAALLPIAIGHVLIGGLQFRDGANFMPISWLQRVDYGARASGFYICPNHLAGLLEVVGIMGLSIVCWSRWPMWGKLLVAYAVGVCYVGLILTGSRGGYLSAGTSLLVFAALSLTTLRRTSKSVFWKAGGLAVIVALFLATLAFFAVHKSAYLSGRAQMMIDTKNIRLNMWKAALDEWKLGPMFGTGSGTYLYYGRYFRRPEVQRDPIHVHNDYLHLLAEYGLAGAAGMTLFLAAHFWRGALNFRRLGPKRVAVSQRILSNAFALNVGALAAVASYLVHSIFDFNLHIPANVLLMAFIFGLLANDGVAREKDALSPPSRAFLWRLALPLLGIVLLVQSIRLFPGEYFSEHARAAVRDNQPAVAIREALKGLPYDPQNPFLPYHLALARMQFGDALQDPAATASFYREALPDLEKAHALAPQDEFFALELATALDAQGRFEEAEWHFYEALQLDPRSESLRRYYEGHLAQWEKYGQPEEIAGPSGS